jgi:hypothetical protein
LLKLASVRFAPYDQTSGDKQMCLVFFITHTWAEYFMFGHRINSEHLGAVCIPIKINIVFGDGSDSLHFYKINIAQPGNPSVWP